jgi:hypothetical protein
MPKTKTTTNQPTKGTERNMVDVLDRRAELREVAQADQLIAALADAFPQRRQADRRKEPRYRYQVRARLELVDEDGQTVDSTSLHTRDVNSRGTGFVTSGDVSNDTRGVLHLPEPGGNTTRVACRVRRSREAGAGWFEGVVEFDDNQPVFSSKRIA